MTPQQSNKILHLRAFAAFWIFSFHIQHFILADYFTPLETFNPFIIINYYGYSAVSFFFCLSGFLFASLYHNKTLKIPAFFAKRFIRIYPLYAVVILSYALFFPYITGQQIINALTFQSYANEMGHLWSIKREFQCYLVFPLILFFYQKWGIKLLIAAYCLLFFVNIAIGLFSEIIFAHFYATFLLRLNEFILGMIFALFFFKLKINKIMTLFVFSLFISSMMGLHFLNWQTPLNKNSYGVIWLTSEGFFYAYLIYAYLKSEFQLPKIINQLLTQAGKLSYSFFLLHFPVVMYFNQHKALLPASFSYFYLFALCLGIAILSYYFIERPLIQFKKYAVRFLS